MGLLDKIINALSPDGDPNSREFQQVITDSWREYAVSHNYFWSVSLNEISKWNDVKNWPDKKKIGFILWLIGSIHHYMQGKRSWSSADKEQAKNTICQAYLNGLFRTRILMDDTDVDSIYEAFTQNKISDWAGFMHWPVGSLLNQLEKQKKDQGISPALRETLLKIRKSIAAVDNYDLRKECSRAIEKVDTLLFYSDNEATVIKPASFPAKDRFSEMAHAAIENSPAADKTFWYQVLPLFKKATGSKPSRKFLDDTKAMIKEFGTDKYKRTIQEWLQFLVELKDIEVTETVEYNGTTYNNISVEYVSSLNMEAIKGIIWTCSHFHDNTSIQTVAALAERAFKKIPGKGPTAAAIGNACLYVLYKSKGLDGIGQLSRLRLRIKQASTQGLIDKYLEQAANEQGVTISEVEDMAVDDLGLENNSRTFLLDDYKAVLNIISAGKTDIKWYKPDGSQQISVPAIVKERHAGKLKKIKDTAKQAEQTLTAQRDRIDRMFRDNRKISMENFHKYYLRHGLMSYLANRIIWNFHVAEKTVQAIHLNDQWVNASNEIVPVENASFVSLWHPVQASVADIKAWRDFLVFHELQQPLKQAFREVYLLTDAEVNTRSYSNRMAAHILRQHQFNSLAKTRGWRYSLMGAFDNGMNSGIASLQILSKQLRAEYWINEIIADGATNETGIWTYVSTDQVRFVDTNTNAVLDLVTIDPLVFSEVMRDADLFVGVASVGNDPAWYDSGGLPAYQTYWQNYSFGELSQIAKNRKEILAGLVPRLKIKDVTTIKDKFLVVKGKLRTYKIHIGSTNILMEPNDQYLCIVPDRSQKDHTQNIFLPFEGDNGLSIILSKAFLLAEDDKITDDTIISQLNRK